MNERISMLPEDSATRKIMPIYSAVLMYFPGAIAELAKHSYLANEKHNPGEKLYWNRPKSADHLDCIARHLMDAGGFDGDGLRHSTGLFWRAGANLQLELEEAGLYPVAPASIR